MQQVMNLIDDIKSSASRQRDLCNLVTLDIKNAFNSTHWDDGITGEKMNLCVPKTNYLGLSYGSKDPGWVKGIYEDDVWCTPGLCCGATPLECDL